MHFNILALVLLLKHYAGIKFAYQRLELSLQILILSVYLFDKQGQLVECWLPLQSVSGEYAWISLYPIKEVTLHHYNRDDVDFCRQ